LNILHRDRFPERSGQAVPRDDVVESAVVIPRQQKSFGRKQGKQVGPCGCKGISKLLLKRKPRATTGAKVLQPVVFPVLQGKGPERKEASLLA
jgi:hypothetical protein